MARPLKAAVKKLEELRAVEAQKKCHTCGVNGRAIFEKSKNAFESILLHTSVYIYNIIYIYTYCICTFDVHMCIYKHIYIYIILYYYFIYIYITIIILCLCIQSYISIYVLGFLQRYILKAFHGATS